MRTKDKQPIVKPDNIDVKISDGLMIFSGPNGIVSKPLPPGIILEIDGNNIQIVIKQENDKSMAYYGLTRALINNCIKGVTEGFEKILEIEGVGYRAEMKGETLVLSLGFSHQINVNSREGIKYSVDGKQIKVSGPDNEKVGDAAAKIRSYRPPEPYKGKGIHYLGEYIRRKAGKAGKVGGGA